MDVNGKLIIVPTPLGNIEDVSIRVLRILFESRIFAAEDTRTLGKLKMLLKERYPEVLEKLGISLQSDVINISYREQNHEKAATQILNYLGEGNDVVLTTDAGMPGISDPGYRLVREVIENGFELDVIPGPSAVINALVLSGLPTDNFTFLGFLPRKRGRIKKLIENVQIDQTSVVIFESPFRVVKTLEIIRDEIGGNIEVAACAELTKKFQRVERGLIDDVIKTISSKKVKGEWTIVLRITN
jgi:16S rRNA (cytidine1402-2'-O)-methyltransferase